MSYASPSYVDPDRVVISTMSPQSLGMQTDWTAATFASLAWPTANKAFFVPFSITESYAIQKGFVYNGATASGNWDVGVYDTSGNLLASTGSTAQVGVSVVQTAALTYTLAPGTYYIACAFDGVTGTVQRFSETTPDRLPAWGVAEMASAFVLPSAATLVRVTSSFTPIIGISARSIL